MKTGTMLLRPEKRGPGLRVAALCIFICSSLIFSAGCASFNAGYDFPADQVRNIQLGITSKEEIRNTFGEPWRVGLENGQQTWTYGKYSYRGFKETDAKDLVVRFTEQDIVESYTFSATNR
jgi:outer membrane protein assembly factor BamE (lipoprotein component of BamABCDE complex)